MVFPQVPKDPPKDQHAASSHPRPARYVQQPQQQQQVQPQVMIAPPLVVQHYAQNLHTEMQLGIAPPASGGGFFASGLFRTRQPARPRAFSMLPLTTSASQEEIGNQERVPLLNTRRKLSSNRGYRQRYYPLSQEDTIELLLLLNQESPDRRNMSVFIVNDSNIGRKATRCSCSKRYSRMYLDGMPKLQNNRRRYSTLLTVSDLVRAGY
ncbi:unnamed protein product [Caenorhabditis auriculariae]|uniref:Uncharacterized protein n=1 Tax=Caenorhabditis auriculariae TaxID=2777116 RepID=A0A8S1H1Y2_9PELO|nr:unnamed protein product [Caenorhabditis auriculariae]